MVKITKWLKNHLEEILKDFGKPQDGKIKTLLETAIANWSGNQSKTPNFFDIAKAYQCLEDWEKAGDTWTASALHNEGCESCSVYAGLAYQNAGLKDKANYAFGLAAQSTFGINLLKRQLDYGKISIETFNKLTGGKV